MPQRFGAAADYSNTFAALARSNDATLRARAEAFDRRQQERAAANDSLMFERFQQGQISGGEILAYIRRRISQTSYDKAQQKQWREALVQYRNSIADSTAEAEFEQTQDIHALIAHYSQRLRGSAKGTPDFQELTSRLRQLRTQRDTDDLRKGAMRIARRIENGNASWRDLIRFYQYQLQKLPANSPLRETARQGLQQARDARREESLTIALQKVDTALTTTQISPQEAARRKEDILRRFDLKGRDPVRYWQEIDQIKQLRATPDPAELAKLEALLKSNQISVNEYQRRIFKIADRIAPFNATAAWQLRSDAIKGIEGATPLPKPEALGSGVGGNSIKFKTQLDGSKYSQYNCTMAAGAMLAHAMGAKGLSGGDLRYLSGVTAQGTNIQQLQGALQNAGVDGTRIRYQNRIEFEQFKRRVMNGAPAVLSGWNGDIPPQYNSSGIIAGHAMFVAGYDPKKNAFLMYDPAKSSDKGTWWPASIVRDFGWEGLRHGQALFAPKNTVDPETLRRTGKAAANVRHVSVNQPPQRPETPPSYVGQFDPGPDAKNSVIGAQRQAQKRERRRIDRRVARAGVDENIDTVEEARAEIDRRFNLYTQNAQILEEWELRFDGSQDSLDITIGATTTRMSADDIAALSREMLYLLDGQELLYEALEDAKGMKSTRELKRDIVKKAVSTNTMEHEFAENKILQETLSAIRAAEASGNPEEMAKAVEEFVQDMDELDAAGGREPEPAMEGDPGPPAPPLPTPETEVEQQADQLDDIAEGEQAEGTTLASVLDALVNDALEPEDRIEAMEMYLEAFDHKEDSLWGQVLKQVTDGANADFEVAKGNATWVLFDGELWPAPLRPSIGAAAGGGLDASLDEQGQIQPDMVPDLSGFEAELNVIHPDQLPRVPIIGDLRVTALPKMVDYKDHPFLIVEDKTLLEPFGIRVANGAFLSNDDISSLAGQIGLQGIQRMIIDGGLKSRPFRVEQITMPDYTDEFGKRQPGTVWYKHPVTNGWTEGGLPFAGGDFTIPGIPPEMGLGFIGVDQAVLAEYGAIVPDVETDPELFEESTTEVSSPFNPNFSVEQMQYMADQGLLSPPSQLRLDTDGNIVPRTPEDKPMYREFKSLTMAVDRAQAEAERAIETARLEDIESRQGEAEALREQKAFDPFAGLTLGTDLFDRLDRELGIQRDRGQEQAAPAPPPPAATIQANLDNFNKAIGRSPLPRIRDDKPSKDQSKAPPPPPPAPRRRPPRDPMGRPPAPPPKPRPPRDPLGRPPAPTPTPPHRPNDPFDPRNRPPGSGGSR